MIKVGNAPCSWGVIENVEGERSGYVRVIDEIAQTGYAGTELGDWGFMPTDPEALRKELAGRKLDLMGTWVNVKMNREECYQESLDNALRAATQLSKVGVKNSVINLGDEVYLIPERTKNAGRIKPTMGLSKDQWAKFGERCNRLAAEVKKRTGILTCFHHHIGTWVETPAEIDALMANTDPALIHLCFDTGHCYFGGGDPATVLAKYYDRVAHVHFKDCDNKVAEESRKQGWDAFQSLDHAIFPELGKGNVDFAGVMKILKDKKYDGWIIVEQDIIPGKGTPKESAQRNRDYIRKLGA